MGNAPSEEENFLSFPQAIRTRVNTICKNKQMTWQRRCEIAQLLMQQKEKANSRKGNQHKRIVINELFNVFHTYARGGWVHTKVLYSLLSTIVLKSQQMHLIMLWGGGSKKAFTQSDTEMLHIITSLLEGLYAIYNKGITLEVIIADVHIANNGYGELKPHEIIISEDTQVYLSQLRVHIQKIHKQYAQKNINIKLRVRNLSMYYEKHKLPYTTRSVYNTKIASEIVNYHKDFLLLNAQKFNKSGITPWKAAVKYVVIRRREQEIFAGMQNTILLGSGISIGAEEIIVPQSMPAVFFGKRSPWFVG